MKKKKYLFLQKQCYRATSPTHAYDHGHLSSPALGPRLEKDRRAGDWGAREERRMKLEPPRAAPQSEIFGGRETERGAHRYSPGADTEEGVYLTDDQLKRISGNSKTHSNAGTKLSPCPTAEF